MPCRSTHQCLHSTFSPRFVVLSCPYLRLPGAMGDPYILQLMKGNYCSMTLTLQGGGPWHLALVLFEYCVGSKFTAPLCIDIPTPKTCVLAILYEHEGNGQDDEDQLRRQHAVTSARRVQSRHVSDLFHAHHARRDCSHRRTLKCRTSIWKVR